MSFYKSMMAGLDPLLAGIVFEEEGGGGGGEFGEDGFNSEGFNAEGFNSDGYNSDGFNSEGYNSDGLDSNGKAKGDGVETSWRDSITDEGLKPIAERFNSPTDVVKAVSDLRKQVSTSIRIPGEDAKPEDIAKFHKALGVPDSPSDYKFNIPEGREATDADTAFHGKLAEIFHKSGIPAAAAGQLNELWNELTVQAEEAQATADKKLVEETSSALQTKWGTDFERNKNLASRAAKYLSGDSFEALQQLEMKDGRFFLDSPIAMEMLAKAGAEMDEDGFQKMDPEGAASIQSEINTLNQELHEAHLAGNTKKAGELNTKVQALYQKLHGSQSAVGEGGRTA